MASKQRRMLASMFASTSVAIGARITTAEAAEAFALNESAYGQGSSFAGMAAPGDSISSMFWNPAAVTTVTSTTVEDVLTTFSPQSELDVDLTHSTLAGFGITGNGGDVGETGFAPAGYFAVPITDEFYFGMSVTAPYGLTTTSNVPWVGMFSHLDAEVISINATPVLGIKFNDMVSAAIGMQVQYFDVNIETALSTAAAPPRQRLEGDSTDVGLVAGVTLTPFDGTTIGIGYRSAVEQSLTGSQTFDVSVPTPLGTILAGRYPISADVKLPETVSVGVRQKINGTSTIMAGMEWTNWSRIQTVPFVGSPAESSLALNYSDGWFFSVGGEYKFNPNWTFRGGLGYDIVPTKDENRSMRLAEADRIFASIGATYNWNERLSIDAGYSHLFVKDGPVDETSPSGIRYAGTAEGSANVISIGIRYKFEQRHPRQQQYRTLSPSFVNAANRTQSTR
jgi:long-chain fatty acid transport protein